MVFVYTLVCNRGCLETALDVALQGRIGRKIGRKEIKIALENLKLMGYNIFRG